MGLKLARVVTIPKRPEYQSSTYFRYTTGYEAVVLP